MGLPSHLDLEFPAVSAEDGRSSSTVGGASGLCALGSRIVSIGVDTGDVAASFVSGRIAWLNLSSRSHIAVTLSRLVLQASGFHNYKAEQPAWNIGLELGVLSQKVFSMMVLMALITR